MGNRQSRSNILAEDWRAVWARLDNDYAGAVKAAKTLVDEQKMPDVGKVEYVVKNSGVNDSAAMKSILEILLDADNDVRFTCGQAASQWLSLPAVNAIPEASKWWRLTPDAAVAFNMRADTVPFEKMVRHLMSTNPGQIPVLINAVSLLGVSGQVYFTHLMDVLVAVGKDVSTIGEFALHMCCVRHMWRHAYAFMQMKNELTLVAACEVVYQKRVAAIYKLSTIDKALEESILSISVGEGPFLRTVEHWPVPDHLKSVTTIADADMIPVLSDTTFYTAGSQFFSPPQEGMPCNSQHAASYGAWDVAIAGKQAIDPVDKERFRTQYAQLSSIIVCPAVQDFIAGQVRFGDVMTARTPPEAEVGIAAQLTTTDSDWERAKTDDDFLCENIAVLLTEYIAADDPSLFPILKRQMRRGQFRYLVAYVAHRPSISKELVSDLLAGYDWTPEERDQAWSINWFDQLFRSTPSLLGPEAAASYRKRRRPGEAEDDDEDKEKEQAAPVATIIAEAMPATETKYDEPLSVQEPTAARPPTALEAAYPELDVAGMPTPGTPAVPGATTNISIPPFKLWRSTDNSGWHALTAVILALTAKPITTFTLDDLAQQVTDGLDESEKGSAVNNAYVFAQRMTKPAEEYRTLANPSQRVGLDLPVVFVDTRTTTIWEAVAKRLGLADTSAVRYNTASQRWFRISNSTFLYVASGFKAAAGLRSETTKKMVAAGGKALSVASSFRGQPPANMDPYGGFMGLLTTKATTTQRATVFLVFRGRAAVITTETRAVPNVVIEIRNGVRLGVCKGAPTADLLNGTRFDLGNELARCRRGECSLPIENHCFIEALLFSAETANMLKDLQPF